jgi:exopolysaccharide biosynthesis polyprenyl glycosylphosphotransferase
MSIAKLDLNENPEAKVLVPDGGISFASDRRWQLAAHPSVKRCLFVLSDILALMLAHVLASNAVTALFQVPSQALDPARYWIFFVPFFAAILYLFEGYGSADLRRPERELELSFKAVSFAFLALLAADTVVFKGLAFSRYLILIWFLVALPLVYLGRSLLRSLYVLLWRNGLARSRALLIGSPEKVARYQQLLSLQRHNAYEVVGIIYTDDHRHKHPTIGHPILGSLDHWEDLVRKWDVRLIVLNLSDSPACHDLARNLIERCRHFRVNVDVFADTTDSNGLTREFDYFTGCFRLSGKSPWSGVVQRGFKYVIDVIFGLFGSTITLLLTPVIALLINLEDRGSVFYPREFVGCDGRTHYYLKFRTMVRNADEILQQDPGLKARFVGNYKLREDPRVLRVGRFLRRYSIDEFPQFFSLLTGQLTLVGPRVIANEEKHRYGDFLNKRLSVKPGMTGYWQVMGRQRTTYDERIQMDMFYIDHWSIWLDLFIIAKTFAKVVWPEGAY